MEKQNVVYQINVYKNLLDFHSFKNSLLTFEYTSMNTAFDDYVNFTERLLDTFRESLLNKITGEFVIVNLSAYRGNNFLCSVGSVQIKIR